jgi:hypothetical protein
MVEIISRRDGPRPEDARLKSLIETNRPTITRIADHLTQGGYSASKAAKSKPVPTPERASVHVLSSTPAPVREARPVVRATLNGRVVVVDDESGRQLHHLGEIRRRDGALWFVLATAANRFPAPAAVEITQAIEDLDAAELAADGGEEALVAEIAQRLGFEAQ